MFGLNEEIPFILLTASTNLGLKSVSKWDPIETSQLAYEVCKKSIVE